MSRHHTATLPSGLVITFKPVTVRRMIAMQGIGRTMVELSPWIADVCDLPLDTILDLEGNDWHALAHAIVATMTPSKGDAAPLGAGQPQPEKAAP
jgi:hypothetical protein